MKRQRKKPAPIRAARPTTPMTTPAAMAAVLGPSFLLESLSADAVLVAISCCPLALEVVTTAPFAFVVVESPLVVEVLLLFEEDVVEEELSE